MLSALFYFNLCLISTAEISNLWAFKLVFSKGRRPPEAISFIQKIVPKVDEVDETGWEWMEVVKVGESDSGWKWMQVVKVDAGEWKWMKVVKVDAGGYQWLKISAVPQASLTASSFIHQTDHPLVQEKLKRISPNQPVSLRLIGREPQGKIFIFADLIFVTTMCKKFEPSVKTFTVQHSHYNLHTIHDSSSPLVFFAVLS